ncbi:SDR family oxidoreductase [Candidatus Uabimicrobium sp. HlEnr_7]|uniref:SDR family oxidoreductase n=1 Tax=Candidatus Uabimicrobium helgolandensis TaxID=3095367 RepID=UPI0035588BE7
MNILLTGVTGILGSQILYDLLYLFIKNNSNGQIFLPVRTSKKSGKERVKSLLNDDVLPDKLKSSDLKDFWPYIHVIECDLQDLNEKHFESFGIKNCYLIHTAASTNLDSSDKVKSEIYSSNYLLTLQLLEVSKKFICKFIFISTAYSCGIRSGVIDDDFLSLQQCEYRNPYENFKAQIEKEIVSFCESKNIEWQIMRPSIICGRLLKSPLYFISKFNVFYSYLKFFYKSLPLEMKEFPIRICLHRDSHMNLVPVDLVAQAITNNFLDPEIKQLNIVGEDIEVHWIVEHIFAISKLRRFEFINETPDKQNPLEKIYYSSIHSIFGKYMNSPKLFYKKNKIIEPFTEKLDIKKQFTNLSQFAIEQNFKNCKW